MKKILRLFAILALLQGVIPAVAQLNNSAFYNLHRLHPSDSNSLQLKLNALAFTKNMEYFNPIADGYTLFGYHFAPTIQYQPLNNFAVEGGLFLRKDFGSNGFRTIKPLFRITYEKDSLQLIFGNINGALAHRLIEPLYDFDRFLLDPVENGLQVRYSRESWWIDGWLEWQRMIYEGDPEQEEVIGGISMEKRLFTLANTDFYLPLQAQVYHRGGQIDTSPEHLVTLVNTAAGIRLQTNTDGFIKRWQASIYYSWFKDFSNEKLLPYTDGHGIYINGSVTTAFHLQTMLSYWKGNEFISIAGGQLYPSVSSVYKNPGHIEDDRELLILRFSHELKVYKGIYITGRFEPFFDLKNETFEFSHGLYISYKQPVTLLKNVLK